MLPASTLRSFSRQLLSTVGSRSTSFSEEQSRFGRYGRAVERMMGVPPEERDSLPASVDPANYASPWAKRYLEISIWCRHATFSATFNNIVTFCIILAGVIVGMQTFESLEDNPLLAALDFVVLLAFSAEFIFKVVGEGFAPQVYFTGPERAWNTFDALVLFFSWDVLPLGSDGGSTKVVRLFRLLRVAKLMKKVPQLTVICTGLIGGLRSIFYILVLLFLTLYLYACTGVIYFGKSDPFHFGTLGDAILSLFSACTLEDWTEVMYIGIYGCDVFPGGIYLPLEDRDGHFMDRFYCIAPKKQKWVSILYWVSFIVISSLVMLSLFIGTVTMAMSESMGQMKEQADTLQREKKLARAKMAMQVTMQAASQHSMKVATSRRKGVPAIIKISKEDRERIRQLKMLNLALRGHDILTGRIDVGHEELRDRPLVLFYKRLSDRAHVLVESDAFQGFVTVVIVAAGILAGVASYATLRDSFGKTLAVVDATILAIFCFEFVLKVIAEEFIPLHVFKSPWNRFDFFVIVGCSVPEQMTGGFVAALRMLRLLRVLKLVRALPRLQVIVSALLMGFQSIFYIGVILLLFFYCFAVAGMLLFEDNDPWHFRYLPWALLTLFRCSTLEDWTDVMYINMYGCDQYLDIYGQESAISVPKHFECTNPKAQPLTAAAYFIVFIVLGAMILLTLFIGVVTTSMEDATEKMKLQQAVEARVKAIARRKKMCPQLVASYRKVFRVLDLDGGGTIERDELDYGLEAIGRSVDPLDLELILAQVDFDDSGEIDFAEFLEFMLLMKREKTINMRKAGRAVPLEALEEDEQENAGGSVLNHAGKSLGRLLRGVSSRTPGTSLRILPIEGSP